MNSQQQINTKEVIDKIKDLGLVNICQENHLSLMVPSPSPDDSVMRPDSMSMNPYYLKNRERLQEEMVCECGNRIKKCSYSAHMKSKKHLTALEKREEKIRQNIGNPLFYVKKVGQPSLSYGKQDAVGRQQDSSTRRKLQMLK